MTTYNLILKPSDKSPVSIKTWHQFSEILPSVSLIYYQTKGNLPVIKNQHNALATFKRKKIIRINLTKFYCFFTDY